MFDRDRHFMKDPQVIDLYENNDNKFDLVMIGYFLNNFQIGIAQKLKVPVVLLSAMFQWDIFNSIVGNPTEVSYVPTMDARFQGDVKMSLIQRLRNFISSCYQYIFIYLLEKDNAEIY